MRMWLRLGTLGRAEQDGQHVSAGVGGAGGAVVGGCVVGGGGGHNGGHSEMGTHPLGGGGVHIISTGGIAAELLLPFCHGIRYDSIG